MANGYLSKAVCGGNAANSIKKDLEEVFFADLAGENPWLNSAWFLAQSGA